MSETRPAISGCVVCKSPRRTLLYRWGGGFGVHRCDECGLMYTNPPPTSEQLTEYYTNLSRDEGEEHGHMRPYTDIEELLPIIRGSVARYLEIVEDIVGRGCARSFLDVGAGVGMYTKAAESLGLEPYYVEIDEQALAFARDRLELPNVLRADIQQLSDHPDGPFDIVLSRHTIEHLLDPGRFAANLSRLVAPGKVLVLETPNAANVEQWAHPRMFAFHWGALSRNNPSLSPPRRLVKALGKPLSAATPPKHLYGFDRRNLTMLLERNGFRVRETVVTVAGDPVFDPLYYLDGGRPPRSALGRVYRLYERAAGALVRRAGRGSRLIVFAQRI
jgi:2-polyprenyl-3-methyl-5-hydroxy-6-metoxy-1,4-benzoquinol methylase